MVVYRYGCSLSWSLLPAMFSCILLSVGIWFVCLCSVKIKEPRKNISHLRPLWDLMRRTSFVFSQSSRDFQIQGHFQTSTNLMNWLFLSGFFFFRINRMWKLWNLVSFPSALCVCVLLKNQDLKISFNKLCLSKCINLPRITCVRLCL